MIEKVEILQHSKGSHFGGTGVLADIHRLGVNAEDGLATVDGLGNGLADIPPSIMVSLRRWLYWRRMIRLEWHPDSHSSTD